MIGFDSEMQCRAHCMVQGFPGESAVRGKSALPAACRLRICTKAKVGKEDKKLLWYRGFSIML